MTIQNPCRQNKSSKFISLGVPQRVWAIPAIHSEAERLYHLHDQIAAHFQTGDKIVYMGNYSGYNPGAIATINELLTFRRLILSIQGVRPNDIIYLRGTQEELFQRLYQLAFSPTQTDTFLWMLGNGLGATLSDYGVCAHEGIEACRNGTVALTRYIETIRRAVRQHKGHETFFSQTVRAAYTEGFGPYPMLFVHAGLNNETNLDNQGDAIWWGDEQFLTISEPYKPFEKVVRGYDPKHSGIELNCVTATLDNGCGFGGNLICTGFDQDGQITETLAA